MSNRQQPHYLTINQIIIKIRRLCDDDESGATGDMILCALSMYASRALQNAGLTPNEAEDIYVKKMDSDCSKCPANGHCLLNTWLEDK